LVLLAFALNARGYAAMQRGDGREALKCYEQYLSLVRNTENGVARNLILGRAAEAFLLAGRVDDAAQLVDQAIAAAEFAKAPHYLALAWRVQGQIFAVQQKGDDALRAFDDAIATFTQLGSRLELARAVYHRAALRLVRGDAKEHEAARADAARARDAFAEMGAVRDRMLAEQLLQD
jgi:tetratricopeptide (TPR) repeat protein